MGGISVIMSRTSYVRSYVRSHVRSYVRSHVRSLYKAGTCVRTKEGKGYSVDVLLT